MSLRATDSQVRDLLLRSRDLIISCQADSGAFPAAPTYPVYRHCWFRDGAFIADALSRHQAIAEADAFHRWCAARIDERTRAVEHVVERLQAGVSVSHHEFLPTRYALDGAEAGEEWWDFQTDGYGTWLWVLRAHLRRHDLDAGPYRRTVATMATYLQAVWSQSCYDWWEEHPDRQHVSTLGSIAAGLTAALEMRVLEPELAAKVAAQRDLALRAMFEKGRVNGHLVKWLGGSAVDGSLLACIAPFHLLDTATAQATISAIETDLVHEHGVYRYLDDTFYGGGRWPVLTAFYGMALAWLGRTGDAHAALDWIAGTATSDGYLPEQVGPRLLYPHRRQEWIERWGPVATPLLWSHAMFLTLADVLGVPL